MCFTIYAIRITITFASLAYYFRDLKNIRMSQTKKPEQNRDHATDQMLPTFLVTVRRFPVSADDTTGKMCGPLYRRCHWLTYCRAEDVNHDVDELAIHANGRRVYVHSVGHEYTDPVGCTSLQQIRVFGVVTQAAQIWYGAKHASGQGQEQQRATRRAKRWCNEPCVIVAPCPSRDFI